MKLIVEYERLEDVEVMSIVDEETDTVMATYQDEEVQTVLQTLVDRQNAPTLQQLRRLLKRANKKKLSKKYLAECKKSAELFCAR